MNVPKGLSNSCWVDGCGNMSWHGARMTEKGGARWVAASKDLWVIDDQCYIPEILN